MLPRRGIAILLTKLFSTQSEPYHLQNVNQAGIALHPYGCKMDNAGQNFAESVRRGQTDTNLVQHINGTESNAS